MRLLAVLLALLIFSPAAIAEVKENCTFIKNGTITVVKGLDKVPKRYREKARCTAAKKANNVRLAKPSDIQIEGTKRRQTLSTSLGRVTLRWPRSVEKLFGRTPSRAVGDAARAVARSIRKPGFPKRVRNMDVKWDIVFLDEELPDTQIPSNLISNCHPGWMTPPGNIYIVGQRVAAGCSGRKASSTKIADADLAEVLVHEMGHAVEWQLLSENNVRNRKRAEGFATWFEAHVAKHSSLLNEKQQRKKTERMARAAIQQSPDIFIFSGSGMDYSRASQYFNVMVKRRGVRGLVRVYDQILENQLPFFEAVDKVYNWDEKKLNKEVNRYLSR